MSFQFVIDNAAELSVNRKPIVGQTISRGSVVRSVTRGTAVWQFDVRLPNGPRWSDYRPAITAIETLNQIESDTIKFNNPGLDWFAGYRGNNSNPNAIEVEIENSQFTNRINIVSAPTQTEGFIFRIGDVIQLGSEGRCYTVTKDVAFNQTEIELHRPLINEPIGIKTLRVGPACEWLVRCINFPSWTIFGRDQVAWNGTFVFLEVAPIIGD